MSGKNQHVVPHEGKWAVRSEGSKRVGSKHETKQEAVDAGRQRAKSERSELLIHNRDGKISSRDSEGHDPTRSKG